MEKLKKRIVLKNDPKKIFESTKDGEDHRKNRLIENDIPVKKIAVVFEAEIISSKDQSAIRYQGKFLQVNSFQGKRSKRKTREMAINIAINSPGAKEDAPTLSLAIFNLGKISTENGPVIKRPSKLKNIKSGWLAGLGINKESMANIKRLNFELDTTRDAIPVTIVGGISETTKGNRILKFIADVLDSTKTKVGESVSEEIFKDRNATANEEADMVEKAKQEEENAGVTYLQKVTDLIDAKAEKEKVCKNPNSTVSQKNIAKAKVDVKNAERENARRVWCVKIQSVINLGETPSGTCPIREKSDTKSECERIP